MRLHAVGYGFLAVSISLFILIYVFPASAAAQNLDLLLERAEKERLYNDRYWHILLHYKPVQSGFKSLIDDPNFFLSSDGKTNPRSELEATIKAFFEISENDDNNPRCRFIARYEWLKEKLGIDESVFSEVSCREFNNLMDNAIRPSSAVLVFPAFYMNNPASMFGHTLLRIDGHYQSKLLSYAANYAAYVEDRLGFFYVFKGIFGYYKGYFKVFPYYERVKEYNDTEQRDMWEYTLNLSEEEVRRMFLHLYELKDIYSNYYFFDENCSYNLLFLLEAARPSLHLTDSMGSWVIPVDTIRAVKDGGVVERIDFRPSKGTKIRYIASLLDEDSQKTALHIVERKVELESAANPGSEEKKRILDLAAEVIQYKYNREEMGRDDYLKLFLAALRERSKLGEGDPYKIPTPAPPEDGHLSNRLGLGVGIRGDREFLELKLRPAYHSLTDPDQGYIEGSQIVFLDATVKYYTDNRARLESLNLIDIVSLSARDNFFKPLSWKVKTGLAEKMGKDKEEHLIYQLDPGFGFAFKSEIIGRYYVLAEASLNIGGKLRDSYALGAGILIGTIRTITDSWKLNLSAEALFYELGERFREQRISAIQTFRLDQNNSLNLSVSWESVFDNERGEAKLLWNYYF